MSLIPHITGARQQARVAQVEARGELFDLGSPALLQEGRVISVTDGLYTVGVLGDDGELLTVLVGEGEEAEEQPITYTNVRTFPEAELAVDDDVYLVFQDGAGINQPTIFAGGGSGYGCAHGILDFGGLDV